MIEHYNDIKLDTDVAVNTNNYMITVNTKMTDEQLYSWLKILWMESSHYIKFLFPMTSYTDLFGNIHVALINDWKILGIHNLTQFKRNIYES